MSRNNSLTSIDEDEIDHPMSLSIKGPLGQRKKKHVQRTSKSPTFNMNSLSSGSSSGPSNLSKQSVRFESTVSDGSAPFLCPSAAHGSVDMEEALRSDSLGLPTLQPIRTESLLGRIAPGIKSRTDSIGMSINKRTMSISQGMQKVFSSKGSVSRRGTTTEFFSKNMPGAGDYDRQLGASPSASHAASNRRLSMWGEQLHDKLFAKKDVKEVMRKKLKLNLKDEGNNTPQIYQTDIKNIVDFDDEDKQNVVKSHFASEFIESTSFRLFILFTIVINSIFIALQTDKDLERKLGYIFSAADQLILTIFVCEILLKWYGGFFTYWKVGWNVFDFIIVAASLVGPSFTFMSNSRVLRILRVLRAFRSLRSISALRPLQLVVQTIIQSLPDMANILLLLVIFMFVSAVIGVSFFSLDSPEYFGSLEKAMFSLFVCITLDGWVEIFNSLREKEFMLASIYFTLFILVGAFILINLVVAVVVTNLESAIAEQDELDLQQIQEEKGNQGQDDNEELRTYDLSDVIHKKFWKHQKPIEIPNLPALNPHKIQNYMILVTAMEDNYSEMMFLREELAKIAKEVWEWNSPVDDDEEALRKQQSKKKSSTCVEEETEQNSSPKRFSTLAHLLTRASVMTTTTGSMSDAATRRSTRSKIKRKSTITSGGYVTPLNAVEEEEDADESAEIGMSLQEEEMLDQERGVTRISLKDETATKDETAITVAEEEEEEEASSYDSVDSNLTEGPQVADLYADMRRASVVDSKMQRMGAINERRASLVAEIERRDRRGDVLSDMIKMNKKTNNFSGKSQNLNQFVHGVDWISAKVKGADEAPERKKKWQLEAEYEKSGAYLEGGARRASVTSANIVGAQLSYFKVSGEDSAMNLMSNEEDMIKRVGDLRRASLITIKHDIDALNSSLRDTPQRESTDISRSRSDVLRPSTKPDVSREIPDVSIADVSKSDVSRSTSRPDIPGPSGLTIEVTAETPLPPERSDMTDVWQCTSPILIGEESDEFDDSMPPVIE